MSMRWLHNLMSPPRFYRLSQIWLPYLAVISLALLITGAVWGLLYAPPDARQGNSYRIIFIHVPAALVALAGYYVMVVAAILTLVWRIKLAAIALNCFPPLGAAMTAIALLCGSLWGIPTWGDWWVWDARVTSMLVLLFLYIGMIMLHHSFDNQQLAARAVSVLTLVGSINILIIYKSVDWWYSLHQPASIRLTAAPSIHPSMWYPLLVMIIGFYLFYVWAFLLWLRHSVIKAESKTKWVHDLCTLKISTK